MSPGNVLQRKLLAFVDREAGMVALWWLLGDEFFFEASDF